MRILATFPVTLLLLSSTGAGAAVKLTYERKAAGEPSPTNGTFIIDPEHVRVEGMMGGRRGGGVQNDSAMIIDGPNKKILMVDPEHKVYREFTEADAKQIKERMTGMKAQMAERLKSVPPEQRKLIEDRMAGAATGGPETKFEATGTKKKIAGFACEVYRVQRGAGPAEESCFAAWDSGLLTKTEATQLKKLAADMEKSFDFIMRAASWSRAPGLPIETTHAATDGKTPAWTNTLKSVSRSAIPASEFQAPAGFTKEALPAPGGPPPGFVPGGPGGRHGGPPTP